MPTHLSRSHRIRIPLPADQCQRLFTPAGEELWVEGWRPRYLHPADGRTQAGMVFTTGAGDELTFWTLVDYSTGPGRHARYTRVTPALRSAFVEVTCTPLSPDDTDVEVRYTLTALTQGGEAQLAALDDAAFAAMIDGWRSGIEARLPELRSAVIR